MKSFWRVDYECLDGSNGMMVYKVTDKAHLSKGEALALIQKAKPDAHRILTIKEVKVKYEGNTSE